MVAKAACIQNYPVKLVLLARLSVFLFLYVATGCHTGAEQAITDKKGYTFDLTVIEKLPIYDSLVTAILEKAAFFQQQINEHDSYRGCKYRPLSDQPDVIRKLPGEVAPKIEHYFNQLGKGFIYGFDVFKDSTVKIYIRTGPSDDPDVTIDENLSYYPGRNSIRRRELPIRDTLLNEHWQYWTRFTKQGIFSRFPF